MQELYSRRTFLNPNTYSPKLTESNKQDSDEIAPVYDTEQIDRMVREKIERYLGLTVDDVECFIRPGNHVLDKNHIEFIIANEINHLTGELSLNDLSNLLLNDDEQSISPSLRFKRLIYRLMNPGIGASTSERVYHKLAIKTLLEKGYTISTADGDSDQLWSSREKPPDLTYYINAGLIAALIGTSVLANIKNKMSRRKFLRVLSKASAALAIVSTEEWLRSLTFPSPIPFKRNKFGEQINDAQIHLEKSELFGDDQDEILGTFTELHIERRNEILALNFWHIIGATSGNNQSKNRILAYMGNGHGKAVDNFLEGPIVLEQKVRAFAEALLTDGLSYLIELRMKDLTVTDSEIIFIAHQAVIGWAKFFEDAVSIGKSVPEGIDSDKLMPSTARAVFIDTLLEQIDNVVDRNEDDSRKKVLGLKVLQNVKDDLIQNLHLISNETIPAIRQAAGIVSPMKKVPEVAVLRENIKIVGMSHKFKQGYSDGKGEMINGVLHLRDTLVAESSAKKKPHEIGIGLTKFKGRYFPVTLRFWEDNDRNYFFTSTQFKLISGFEQNIGSHTYRNVTDSSELNVLLEEAPYLQANLIHDPNSWTRNFFRTSLTIVSIQTLPAFGYSDLYILEGPPETIYDPKIISVLQT